VRGFVVGGGVDASIGAHRAGLSTREKGKQGGDLDLHEFLTCANLIGESRVKPAFELLWPVIRRQRGTQSCKKTEAVAPVCFPIEIGVQVRAGCGASGKSLGLVSSR